MTKRAKFLSLIAAAVATIPAFGVASADSVYVTNWGTDTISILDGGSVTSFGSPALNDPTGIAFDPLNGNLFVANSGNGTISEFSAAGVLINASYATGLGDAQGIAFDSSGNLFVVSKDQGNIYKIADGGATSLYASTVTGINDVAIDKAGNLYVTTGTLNGIKVITTTNFIGDLTITGHPLNRPDGLAFDKNGNLYVANDFDPSIESIAPGGFGSVIVNGNPLFRPRGVIFDSTGDNIWVADEGTGQVTEYNALTGQLITTYTGFCFPQFLAIPTSSLPIPEPSTYAMLIAGLGALYFFGRRRKLVPVKTK